MASACGPEMPTFATVGRGFDDATRDLLAGPEPRLSVSIKTTAPPPNPPFRFPAAPISPRTASRRPLSASEPSLGVLPDASASKEGRSGAAQLPEFSFNPGAGMMSSVGELGLPPLPSTQRPFQPSQSPSRPPGAHRHRRGGSEFVGGSIRMGDSITVMTRDSLKGDGSEFSGGFLPPPNRRGHTRNRSANPSMGSGGTLQALRPVDGNAQTRGASAPASPSDLMATENMLPAKERPPMPSIDVSPAPLVDAPVSHTSDTRDATNDKSRVGFSDAVEYIPRPVSLVSSDASSTVTVRPSHSLTGSVSSLASMSNSPERAVPHPLSRTTTLERTESRPSTAGAVLDRTVSSLAEQPVEPLSRRRNSIPILITVPDPVAVQPASEPSPLKTPKRWSFFGLEPFASSPTRSRPSSSGSNDAEAKEPATGRLSPDHAAEVAGNVATTTVASPSQHSQPGKPKKKKGKKWAGGILTRKAKPRAHKSCENLFMHSSPDLDMMLPPVPGAPLAELVAAVEPPMPVLTVTEPMASPYDVEVSRPVSAPSPDDDASYAMIDLDAALGPFNTPLPRNPEWDAAQKAASHAKRPLHSAQGMKGFSGPGMHYHRRTESAPEMIPFDGPRGGLHRFSSRSTMADVFEEDEEDDKNYCSPSEATTSHGDLSETPRASLPDTMSSLNSEPDTDGDMTPPAAEVVGPILSTGREQSTLHVPPLLAAAPTMLKKECSTPALRQDKAELGGPITFRTSHLFMDNKSADAGDAGPHRAARDLVSVDDSPLQTPPGHQAPASPWSISQASSYPSPRSQMSYDAQIISTAPSSINDEATSQSLLMGEPGPEVRISVDDTPSLCSGASVTTRESMPMPSPNTFPMADSDRPRPVSLVGPFGRRRSSLASIGRLISSSHGERSKLSVEVSVNDEDDDKPKVNRSRRLSRLMQFWKPKDDKEGKERKEAKERKEHKKTKAKKN